MRSVGDYSFISAPPGDVAGWASLFTPESLPVLEDTAASLDEFRGFEDATDAHLIAEIIAADPLMSLKVLSHVGRMRRGREGGEPETVTAALVMLGITPFFNVFGPQPTVEAHLASRPECLEGFRLVLKRCHRAANFALGFAVQRMDHDAAVIHLAALLHDFAELLLWLRAPDLALEISRRQAADSTLRSADVQHELLNVRLVEVQHALMLSWQLPRVLVNITDSTVHTDSAQVRNVELAIRVARHSASGWDNAALPDDFRDIGELLRLGPDPTMKLLREIDD
jgi:HD-like signal output (HDOD) protein